jgi:hypothetical protein
MTISYTYSGLSTKYCYTIAITSKEFYETTMYLKLGLTIPIRAPWEVLGIPIIGRTWD